MSKNRNLNVELALHIKLNVDSWQNIMSTVFFQLILYDKNNDYYYSLYVIFQLKIFGEDTGKNRLNTKFSHYNYSVLCEKHVLVNVLELLKRKC